MLKGSQKETVPCSNCGTEAETILKKKYHAKEIGLDNVVIENMPMISCPSCGSEEPMFLALEKLLFTVAVRVARQTAPLSGKQFKFLRKYLELSPLKCAEILGVTRETVSRWENEHVAVSDIADRFIRTIALMEEHERESVLGSLSAIKKDAVSANIQIDAQDLCVA